MRKDFSHKHANTKTTCPISSSSVMYDFLCCIDLKRKSHLKFERRFMIENKARTRTNRHMKSQSKAMTRCFLFYKFLPLSDGCPFLHVPLCHPSFLHPLCPSPHEPKRSSVSVRSPSLHKQMFLTCFHREKNSKCTGS